MRSESSEIPANASEAVPPPADRLNPVGIALGICAAVFWGSYLSMARAGVGIGMDGFDVAFIRYTVAGLIMLPWLLMHRPFSLSGIGWGRGILLALTAGPPFVLLSVAGYFYAPLAHGAVILPSMGMVATAILASLMFGERVGLVRGFGLAIVIVGLVIVSGAGLFGLSAQALIGDLLFASAGFLWAVFTVLGKRWGVSPLAGTAVVSVLSGMVMVPTYLATVGLGKLAAIPPGMLLAQAVVQGVLVGIGALFAYTRAVQLLGPGRAAVFPALVPACAILLGIPIAGEWPTVTQIAGLAVVTFGMLVALGVVKRRG